MYTVQSCSRIVGQPGTRVPGATISTGSEPGTHVHVPGAVSQAESHAKDDLFSKSPGSRVDSPLRWRLHFQKQHLSVLSKFERVKYQPGHR